MILNDNEIAKTFNIIFAINIVDGMPGKNSV